MRATQPTTFDAIVIGAGFSGLYMLYKLREQGLTVKLLEAADGVGGTWHWNRYPGARCDVESIMYSYSFSPELEQEWNWTEKYPAQPEILAYLNHVADRFDLRRDIQLNTRVVRAQYDQGSAHWQLETQAGERFDVQFCIMATGALSAPKDPQFEGLSSFKGKWYQTSRWPREPVEFKGKQVAVIGTGSTGTQAIPVIAAQAAHLYVFQRTPHYSVPAGNRPLDPEVLRSTKARYRELRANVRVSASGMHEHPTSGRSALEASPEEREQAYGEAWNAGNAPALVGMYGDLLTNLEANETVASFVRRKIREIVKNPEVAQSLTPSGYPFATKRLCLGTNYYDTYNRNNVTLVDVRQTPIQEIVPEGIRTSAATYPLDILVFAVGFDALTGALLNIDIRGRNQQTLHLAWTDGPKTYLGLGIPGFPNLFPIVGPGSPSVLSNMVSAIEQHVEWIADCIAYLRKNGFDSIEATPQAQDAWVEHVREVANLTLYPHANSWYLGANVPGKPRVFMPYIGGLGVYRQKCDEVARNGYEGFVLGRTQQSSEPTPRAAALSS
ncbi:MAG: NAD(P)/FAD-dependent oxidoreductase [Steroidobacteraceae bacterium]